MVKFKLQDVFGIILIIISVVGAIYGTYIFYWDLKSDTNLDNLCILLSIISQIIAGMFILMMIIELSQRTITINTNKIKQNLKQLIK